MADDAPVKNEVSARQGRSGKRTLGVLEWSLGLVVLCFAALLLVAISTTRSTPGDAGRAPIPQSQQPAPGNAPKGQERYPGEPDAGTRPQGQR